MKGQHSWYFTKDLSEFVQKTSSFFHAFESRYVQVCSIIQGENRESICAFILLQDDICTGFVFYDGKDNLYISDVPSETIPILKQQLSLIHLEYKRIAASKDVAEIFFEVSQRHYILEMNQCVFSCSNVLLPHSDGGQMIKADHFHFELASQMFEGFFVDCWPETPVPDFLGSMLRKKIENENVFFWKDSNGLIVSMAAKVRTTTNTASLSWVYTQKEQRGKGYGTKITAYLTHHCLNQGFQECNLFTDASNPVSNYIYTKIGYMQIGEQSVYVLQ